eukprot:m.282772 g.282772  ORF g.282772 m.282772 type:complete len:1253 (+) comp40662_c0_seq2:239-3997(+)
MVKVKGIVNFAAFTFLFPVVIQSYSLKVSTSQSNTLQSNVTFSTFCPKTAGNEWCYINPQMEKKQSHPPLLAESAVATYKRSYHFRLHKVILFGGDTADGQIREPNTWLYTPWTNSWVKVNLNPSPRSRYGHSMVTLCQTKVILHGGLASIPGWHVLTDTWVFDGTTESWIQANLLKNSSHTKTAAFFATTSIVQPQSKCSCKESVIIIGDGASGIASYPLELWELRCIDDKSNLYQWLNLAEDVESKLLPPRGVFAYASVVRSAKQNATHVIVNGGVVSTTEPIPFLWLVDVTRNRWSVLNNYSSESDDIVSSKTIGSSMFLFASQNVLLLINQAKVFAYNLLSNSWMKITCRFCSPPQSGFERPTKASVQIENTILIFGINEVIPDQPYNSIVMNVSIVNINLMSNDIEIDWTANPPPVASPPPLLPRSYSSALVKNSILLFGGLLADVAFQLLYYSSTFLNTNSVWILDLKTIAWHQINSENSPNSLANHCGTIANDDLFIQFAGNTGGFDGGYLEHSPSFLNLPLTEMAQFRETVQETLWSFNTTSHYWLKHEIISLLRPQKRFRCLMTPMRNGSVLLFGGITVSSSLKFQPLNDLWLLTIDSNKKSQQIHAYWSLLSKTCTSSRDCQGPQPRFNNVFEIANGNPVIFGGFDPVNVSGECFDQFLWRFNMRKASWDRVSVQNVSSSSFSPPRNRQGTNCFSTGISIGNKLIVSLWYLKLNFSQDPCRFTATCRLSNQKTMSFALDALTDRSAHWIELGAIPIEILQSELHNFREAIVSMGMLSDVNPNGANSPSFTILLQPGCPKGQFSPDFGNSPCKFCGFSEYSSAASKACNSCPVGSTTSQKNAESISNCSCSSKYCEYGNCLLTYDLNQNRLVKCECYAGFTGTTCKYPTYYLIGIGTIVLSALLTLLVVFIYKSLKAKALKEREMKQLKETFNIPEKEIESLTRIDEDCRGGYSEVCLARYRGMSFVAVKKLLMDLAEIDRTVLLDFIREIKITRLLSHKNIVKFFGAGRFEQTNGPFLVLEHVKRGSLRNILYASPNLVTLKRKYMFALDAAKGMEYLHNQKPPKIHRDLKTANLLVDENWVVKVADFGCSKILKKEGKPVRPKKRRTSICTDEDDLLPEDSVTVWHIGTLYWSAPEVLLRLAYGTPADVFSYGIVLWEIMTRMAPYEEYDDLALCTRQEAKRIIAVEKRRPTILEYIPSQISGLIQICWKHEQKDRPKFSSVVDQLQDTVKTIDDDGFNCY